MTDHDRIVEIGARATFDDYWKRHGDEPGAESVWLQVKHIHIGNMRAVLAAFEEAGLVVEQGWRFDMENAPRDGRRILVHPSIAVNDTCCIAQWGRRTPEWYCGGSPMGFEPTAWRPLPALPAAKADPQ